MLLLVEPKCRDYVARTPAGRDEPLATAAANPIPLMERARIEARYHPLGEIAFSPSPNGSKSPLRGRVGLHANCLTKMARSNPCRRGFLAIRTGRN
jgi:hypothetical protein